MTTNKNRPPISGRRGGRRNESNGRTQHTTFGPTEGKLYSEDGRCVGWIRGDTVYKALYGSKHMMKKPRGWAQDVSALETMKECGVAAIEIEDRETGLHYRAGIADFDKHGVRVNRGYGLQVCLPLGFWSIDGQPPRAKAARPHEPDEPLEPAAYGQMTLL